MSEQAGAPAFHTVALELAPPESSAGAGRAVEIADRVVERCRTHGLTDRIGHVMIPGIIPEDSDRPVPMSERMDVLDFWEIVRSRLDGVTGLCAQVTVLLDERKLADRLRRLCDAGMAGVAFVGKPHGLPLSACPGLGVAEALSRCGELMRRPGVIVIPTRRGEVDRLVEKCERGATFALTQLLYSDRIVDFLRAFAARTDQRPEIVLSFGFIPAAEEKVGLIDWLLHDPGNEYVRAEQRFVAEVAVRAADQRQRALVDLYRRVVDQARGLGFPLSVNLEAPYGVSNSACEAFTQMLDYWSPQSVAPHKGR
ncbi:mycobacterial-type methylenetetrahydrofolate reductase [Speluncibacter jeojiensis]|uniref:Mycobacterial-type methylenetetrahydrofolate reductase n=1 Tax=Speluncibacter jeojiensis TaxID=2710754 RepID=A0A9X4LYK3_9ACTN|nr:mycobacterial-type methylenetetrahydrofolate reductase [Corynebacteriales bacterium D3-21]